MPPAVHAGLPSPYLTVIFTLDDPLAIAAHPDPGSPAAEYLTLAGGLHTAPALITHEGCQSGIQLALSPLGARALLGVPGRRAGQPRRRGRRRARPAGVEIHERLPDAAGWPERFAVLDEVLSRGLAAPRIDRPRPEVSAEVRYAWRGAARAGGPHHRVRAGRGDRLERRGTCAPGSPPRSG